MMDRSRIAYHEAGHAVATHKLELRVGWVTIKPDPKRGTLGTCRGSWALRVRHYPEADTGDKNRMRMERDVITLLAGHEAEFYFSGRRNHVGARGDRRHAIDLLSYFAQDINEKPGRGRQEEFRTYYKLLQIRARQLVRHRYNWLMVKALAERLLEREALSGADAVKAMIDGLPKVDGAALARRARVLPAAEKGAQR